jgi:hypothetical protein
MGIAADQTARGQGFDTGWGKMPLDIGSGFFFDKIPILWYEQARN